MRETATASCEHAKARKDRVARRRPEDSALYQCIAEHWAEFAEKLGEAGGLPRFVREEFEQYLTCGRLEFGCLELQCRSCGHSALVAFSCKRRGFCPGCLGRRMSDTAVHLVQEVLPEVPIRHWPYDGPPSAVAPSPGEFGLIFLHVGADLPLRQTVASIAEGGGPKLTAVRLHLRMRRAQDGTDLRLHAVLRLHDLGIVAAHVTGDVDGETFKRFAWTKGQLVIGDRGYSNPPGVAHVVDQGADLLVRVNRGALPLLRPDGSEIDVLQWVRGFGGNAAVEIDAHVVVREGKTTRVVPGRLIGRQLPKAAAERARQRARREHGPSVSADVMEAPGYMLLFTTAPTSRLSPARCMDAYRLRWQIELQFKRWKSLCHFDRLPHYRDDTMQAWLTAKLLLALLLDRLGSSPVTSSSEQTKRSVTREPWKLTSIIWPTIVAALLPLGLSQLVGVLPAIALRVDKEHAAPNEFLRADVATVHPSHK